MTIRVLFCWLLASMCLFGGDPVAARLARQARDEQNKGQLVRAYMLYAAAAARDPHVASYRLNRDMLYPIAQLLTKAHVESNEDISAEIRQAEQQSTSPEPPIEQVSAQDWQRQQLKDIPHVQPSKGFADFNLRADPRALFTQVASVFGIRVVFDHDLQPGGSPVRFQLDHADFALAMEGATAVTNTFLFPISSKEIFVAPNTPAKRSELEPVILLDFPLPEAMEQRDLVEAANAVRATLGITAVGWDSATRTVLIRDRFSRAHTAQALLEALLLPHGQVSLEVEFLTLDTDQTYHYGLSLQTKFPIYNLGHIANFQTALPEVASDLGFIPFGGGASLFAVGVANSTLFATYSKSITKTLYDATVVVDDRKTANFHVGDKYPIPQALYTGFSQGGGSSLYNPIGQVSMEDLGLILKFTPHINGDGAVDLDLEAQFRSLGTQTFNTVPAIAERGYKGTVSLREGEWAVIEGLDQSTRTRSKNGLLGLSQIPGLDSILSENLRQTQTSNTLVVIKPTITRYPVGLDIRAQYLLGPARGPRVLL